MMKDSAIDLTHLAPTAGGVCIPLPFVSSPTTCKLFNVDTPYLAMPVVLYLCCIPGKLLNVDTPYLAIPVVLYLYCTPGKLFYVGTLHLAIPKHLYIFTPGRLFTMVVTALAVCMPFSFSCIPK